MPSSSARRRSICAANSLRPAKFLDYSASVRYRRAVIGAACRLLLVSAGTLASAWNASAVLNLDVTTVGDPGNPSDPNTGFGSVGYAFAIGKYETTISQYTAF